MRTFRCVEVALDQGPSSDRPHLVWDYHPEWYRPTVALHNRAGETAQGGSRSNAKSRNPCIHQWAVQDSNLRPPACRAGALPAELTARAATDGSAGRGYPRSGRPHRLAAQVATSFKVVARVRIPLGAFRDQSPCGTAWLRKPFRKVLDLRDGAGPVRTLAPVKAAVILSPRHERECSASAHIDLSDK